jgi:hypothetical protein
MSISEDPRNREARATKNQVMFRELNERLKELNEAFSLVVPVGEWICECVNDTCVERIEMSVEAYEAVRRHGARFFIASSDEHFRPDVERVVEHNVGYWVVERTGHAWSPATGDDSRSDNEPEPLSLRT